MVTILLATGCSGGGRPASAVLPPGGSRPPTTAAHPSFVPLQAGEDPVPAASLRAALAGLGPPLTLLDGDLDVNGDLNVPQNRYNIDLEKLATATQIAQSAVLSAAVDAHTRSDVDVLLTAASNLVALEKTVPHPGRNAVAALGKVESALAVVRSDLGTSS